MHRQNGKPFSISMKQEMNDVVAWASTGPYANHLRVAADT